AIESSPGGAISSTDHGGGKRRAGINFFSTAFAIRFVPKADIRQASGISEPLLLCANWQPASLFDQFVGALQNTQRHVEAKRFGGLEVDGHFKLGRQRHRQLGRLFTLQNPADVDAEPAMHIENTGSVADQSTSRGVFTPIVNRRN